MSDTCVLFRLLQMYFTQNLEFGSALLKLQNFRGGGLNHHHHPLRYATGHGWLGNEEWKTIFMQDNQCHEQDIKQCSVDALSDISVGEE
jgi:hypothetical protein